MNDEQAEQAEDFARTMRQHRERDWKGAPKQDHDDYWTMENARKNIAFEMRSVDRPKRIAQ